MRSQDQKRADFEAMRAVTNPWASSTPRTPEDALHLANIALGAADQVAERARSRRLRWLLRRREQQQAHDMRMYALCMLQLNAALRLEQIAAGIRRE